MDNKCNYCDSDQDLTLDHMTPRSRGGDNSIKNLQVLCRSCNCSKGAKTHEEYIAYMAPYKFGLCKRNEVGEYNTYLKLKIKYDR